MEIKIKLHSRKYFFFTITSDSYVNLTIKKKTLTGIIVRYKTIFPNNIINTLLLSQQIFLLDEKKNLFFNFNIRLIVREPRFEINLIVTIVSTDPVQSN